jgi:arabinogalactan endo-1,4-beta-galactosidase
MRYFAIVLLAAAGLTHHAASRGAEKKAPTPAKEFLAGGDISMLTKIEELGGVFRDDGEPRDFLEIFKDCGGNCFRLRLFVKPNYNNAVINDLPYTLALAKRIKKAQLKLLLNFHYSDTWADPGHQHKPAAWADLNVDALERQVEDYTAAVIAAFKKAGVLPELVQVGNEITPGMLWPDGKLYGAGDPEKQWDQFARLVKAGIRGVKKPLAKTDNVRIMIHIDKGGSWPKTKWFFDRLRQRDVDFDVIGLSYYPWWHGTLDALRENLQQTAQAYDKDLVVVETAYPFRNEASWKAKDNMAWPISPAGQRAFMAELVAAVRATPNGRGIGVIYWYPEAIPVKGLKVWNGGATALFDDQGNALPALDAFRHPERASGLQK